jgi:uncharacterized protein (TIGR03437 family)
MKFALFPLLFLISVSAIVGQTPVVVPGGVLNAASFDKTPGAMLAPGQLVSLFGTDLASQLQSNDTVPLSTSLADGVTVTFNGVAAGLDFVSPTQINAQLPWNVLQDGSSTGTATVVVTRNGVTSAPSTINVGQTAPGIFSVPPGAGYAIAINADGTLAAPDGAIAGLTTHPAKIGDVLIVYATGLGAVDSAIANGADSLDKLRNTLAKPVVLIGGKSAPVFFSGLTPQFPGVNQLNIQVPAGAPPGDKIPLQIQVDGAAPSSANVVIAVQ